MSSNPQPPSPTSPHYLGGGMPGVSVKQTIESCKDSENPLVRKILRYAWNKNNMQSSINGHGRVLDPFRAANNLGDYLGRPYYICGGVPNQVVPRRRPGWMVRNAHQTCDATGVAGASCNPRFVSDSSDYIRFKRHSAMLNKYNPMK